VHEGNVWTLNYAKRMSGDMLSKTHKYFTLFFLQHSTVKRGVSVPDRSWR